MDFSLYVLSLQFFRRRMHEIQTIISKAREKFRNIGRHLHVKVTHEVTVELPADWKPRRERTPLPAPAPHVAADGLPAAP
jgi:hypothetical protein